MTLEVIAALLNVFHAIHRLACSRGGCLISCDLLLGAQDELIRLALDALDPPFTAARWRDTLQALQAAASQGSPHSTWIHYDVTGATVRATDVRQQILKLTVDGLTILAWDPTKPDDR